MKQENVPINIEALLLPLPMSSKLADYLINKDSILGKLAIEDGASASEEDDEQGRKWNS